jgi:predicted dienelactone hydrolase
VSVVARVAGCGGGGGDEADDDQAAEPATEVSAPTSTTLDELVPPDELGPHAVGYTTMTVSDPDRPGRELPTSVWYPADIDADVDDAALAAYARTTNVPIPSDVARVDVPVADGRFPLIVFSHGFGGVNTQSFFYTETLASHGFVVAAPDHVGNTAFDQAAGTDVEMSVSAGDRLPDVSTTIDVIVARSDDDEDLFAGHVDDDRVGVTGHSFGGFTTLAMAVETDGERYDPRVDVIVPLAPGSPTSDESLTSITIPTLLMGGTLDGSTPLDPNVTRPWELISSADLMRVDLIDAGHLAFDTPCEARDAAAASDITLDPTTSVVLDISAVDGCGPDRLDAARAHALINRYAVAFFEVHLAGDTRYETFLAPTDDVMVYP